MEDKTKIAVKAVGSQYHLKRDTKLSLDSSENILIKAANNFLHY